MKLVPPFPLSDIVQPFGANQVSYYKEKLGLIGHPGQDYKAEWCEAIPCAVDSYCYSVIKNDDPAFYQVVYTIVDDPDGNSYEVSYGHCATICAQPGTFYKQGDVLAGAGNYGQVFAGGVEVPTAEKIVPPHPGTHLHFQVRLLKKVKKELVTPEMHTINDGTGRYESADGYCYYVPLWSNGENGCIDPAQFFVNEDADLADTIKKELAVLKTQTDLSVRAGFIALIISQLKKLVGF